MCSRGTAEVSSAVTQPVQTWVSPSDWRCVRVRPGASRLWLLKALCPPQNLLPSVRNLHLDLVPEHRQRGQVGRGRQAKEAKVHGGGDRQGGEGGPRAGNHRGGGPRPWRGAVHHGSEGGAQQLWVQGQGDCRGLPVEPRGGPTQRAGGD